MKFVSKTPLRVSFFGGGTDYPDYLDHHPGAVLGTTIDKFVYTFALPMSGVADKPFRLTYRRVEEVDRPDQIQHPVVREVLKEFNWTQPLNIATMADLPGSTGLGSSSSFAVGFLNLIHRIAGHRMTRYDLAREAIRLEYEVLKENVGVQDQIHAAFGGINLYDLARHSFSVTPVRMHFDVARLLNSSMLLVFTGKVRHASQVLESQLKNTREKVVMKQLDHLMQLTRAGVRVLEGDDADAVIQDLGRMLDDAWLTKRSLSTEISNSRVDEVYRCGKAAGALGGKLCGAGGGGFFFFLAPPQTHPAFAAAFGDANVTPIEMTDTGSVVYTFD